MSSPASPISSTRPKRPKRSRVRFPFGRLLRIHGFSMSPVLNPGELVLVGDGVIGGISVLAAFIILAREFLVSGLREFLAASQISVPVTQLAKWKTTVQLVALAILLTGPAGAKLWAGLPAFGIATLWLAALLTAVTGWDYLKGGLPHIQAADETLDEAEQS